MRMHESSHIKEAAAGYFATHPLGEEIQTRISLFLLNIKQINAMILARNELLPVDWPAYTVFHRQYYREMELATLLQRSTCWSLNPFLYAEGARANMVFWARTEAQRYMMPFINRDRFFFEYLALSHAFMAEVRLIPLFSPDHSFEDPFYAALYAVENENGRQIQTQVRFLKDMELDLSRQEKETIVNEKRQVVTELFCDLLAAICRP